MEVLIISSAAQASSFQGPPLCPRPLPPAPSPSPTAPCPRIPSPRPCLRLLPSAPSPPAPPAQHTHAPAAPPPAPSRPAPAARRPAARGAPAAAPGHAGSGRCCGVERGYIHDYSRSERGAAGVCECVLESTRRGHADCAKCSDSTVARAGVVHVCARECARKERCECECRVARWVMVHARAQRVGTITIREWRRICVW